MARFTMRIGIQTDKMNKRGQCPVVCFISIAGKRSVMPLGFSVPALAWDTTKRRLKANAVNAAAINARIQHEEVRIEKDLHTRAEAGQLGGKITRAKPSTVGFYEYVETIFKAMELKGQTITAVRYRNNLPSIREHAGDALRVGDITPEWLKAYETYCRTDYVNPRAKDPVAISQNTIWSRFKMLRKVLLQAEKDGIIPACPLGVQRGGYPMPVFVQVPKDYLTFEEVTTLAALLGDSRLTEAEDMTLAYFLIECTAGIRHSDWSRFTVERLVKGEALKVQGTKKTGAPIYVPIQPGTILKQALSHIKAKGYAYTDKESAAANKRLRNISLISGIRKPMTTHTGRHTAATLLLEKGFSRESVAEVLGVTMKVVDVYAKMTRQKVRNEFDKLGGL